MIIANIDLKKKRKKTLGRFSKLNKCPAEIEWDTKIHNSFYFWSVHASFNFIFLINVSGFDALSEWIYHGPSKRLFFSCTIFFKDILYKKLKSFHQILEDFSTFFILKRYRNKRSRGPIAHLSNKVWLFTNI